MLSVLALTALSAGIQEPPAAAVHPSRLLVKPRAAATAVELSTAHARAGAVVLRDLPQIGWQVVEVGAGRLEAGREAYAREGAIERAELDRRYEPAYAPNDPYWPMWHMLKIRADKAWDTHKGAPSVVVAVIDTGLDTAHPDLAPNVWVNPGEIPGNGVDDDQNGYADDVNGWDFAYGDPIPDDVYGHGTGCAGIVAAAQDNGIGVTGVAPLCRLAGLKAALDSGYLYDSAIVPALLYAADMGFEVATMSFFSDQVTPAERDAIDYAWSKGLLPVAAAGNSSSALPYYPAAYERVVAVAATDGGDAKSWFSNWGTWVDAAAPGESLSTTYGGSYTTGFAGTSGACPHVSGLAALLFAAAPAATNAQVRAALEDTAVPLNQAPYGWIASYGRIDCDAALDRVLGATSGSVPARLVFASPVGGGPRPWLAASTPPPSQPVTLHGVGLEPPNVVRVLANGLPLPILSQSRNAVAVRPPNRPHLLALEVNGQVVGSFQWSGGIGRWYAPSDASTNGGGNPVASGAFAELVRDDGALFTCTRRDDATVVAELAVRGVEPPALPAMWIELTRAWTDCAGGTETIELYDWSTWSYPYGSFVTVSSAPISGSTMAKLAVPAPANPARFLDDEGTMYVRIRATNAGAAGQLSCDSFRVRVL